MSLFTEMKKALAKQEAEHKAQKEAERLANGKEMEDQIRRKNGLKTEWERLKVDGIFEDIARAIWPCAGTGRVTAFRDFSGTPGLVKELYVHSPVHYKLVTLFSITLFEHAIQVLTRSWRLSAADGFKIPSPEVEALPIFDVSSSEVLREKLDDLLARQLREGRLVVDWDAKEQANPQRYREIMYPSSKRPRFERGIPGLMVNNLIKEAIERKNPRRKRHPWGRYRL